MGVLLLLGQLNEGGRSKGYAIFCGLHLVWTGRGLECWDGQKARVSFWVRKRKKNLPPQILSATADLTFVVSPPLTLAVPGIPDFGEGNPKGRHVSVERRPKQGEDVLLKIRKYLSVQRGKDALLDWLWAPIYLSFKIFSILFGLPYQTTGSEDGIT